jgi:glycosyltransferase involved in cell wall biosynthesis
MTKEYINRAVRKKNKKAKILFLIPDLDKGGAERFLVDHCLGLTSYPEIEFKIGVFFDNNQYVEESKVFDIVHLGYDIFSLFRKNENENFKKLLNEFKPDLIHSNLYLAEFLTTFYLDKNITYVCHGHDNMIELDSFKLPTLFNKKKLLNFIEKCHLYIHKYSKVDTYFIANSQHTYDYYKKVLPFRQANSLVKLDYGFQYDRFFYSKQRSIDPDKTLRILNVGSFQHKKNQSFIIDIAKELLNYTENFEIHLIGQGEYFNAVQARVYSENLDEFVFCEGLKNNVEDWYMASDIYLHTAYYEPFGLVFLEAMAAGLPIVCLDGQGNRDIIEHGKNGFIFGEQNPKLFADAIFELSEDNSKYEKMSNYGKSFAKKFDIEIQTDKFVEFYKSILAKK